MALRAGHGNGAGVPRIEVLPPDELPAGVQGNALGDHTNERRADGTFLPGARTAQAAGGHTSAGTARLARRLGLDNLAANEAFAPYKRAAVDFRRAQCRALALSVGGGHCGVAPSSIIASAAWALAASRYLYDTAARTGDSTLFVAASRLAESSRQHLLAAHELCAREAKSRPVPATAYPWLADASEDGGSDAEPSGESDAAEGQREP